MIEQIKLPALLPPASYGRVAVLYGGTSAEREISLDSGAAVLKALTSAGVDCVGVDYHGDPVSILEAEADRVFIALHGRGGEDGSMQGLLQQFGLPYTGSDVLGSALAMDKLRSKRVWQGLNLPTPDFVSSADGLTDQQIIDKLGLPLFVKPAREGSSIGMSLVQEAHELAAAIERASSFDSNVLIEQFVEGAEYTVALLQGQALPVIRIVTPKAFYNFAAKYQANDTEYRIPSGLSSAAEEQLKHLSVQAFDALGAQGWGRIDVMVNAAGEPQLIELNTVPGMTDHSLVPKSAAAAAVGFEQLVLRILHSSLSDEELLNSDAD